MKSTSLTNRDIDASTTDKSGPSDEGSNIEGAHTLFHDSSVRKVAGSTATASSRITTGNTATVDIQDGLKSTIVAGVIPTTSVSSSGTQGIASVNSASPRSVAKSASVVAVSGNTSGGLSVNMPLPIHVVAATPSTITPTSSAAASIAPTGTQAAAAVTSCGAATSVTSWAAGGSTSSGGNSDGHLTVPLVGGGTTAALATLSYVHGSTGIRLIPATISGLHPTAAVAAAVGPPINTLSREVRRCSDSSRAQMLWDAIKAVRMQKQIPAITRMSRYMNRFYHIKKDETQRLLDTAVEDNLVKLENKIGTKGTKSGIEEKAYRLPTLDMLPRERHDW